MLARIPEGSAERNPLPDGISLDAINTILQQGLPALGIYLHLLTKANTQLTCYATNPELEQVTGASANTVRKYLKSLMDTGFITVLDRGDGRGKSTLYTVKDCRLIVNDFTQKGSTTVIKGSTTAEKGFNDSNVIPFNSTIKGSTTPEKGFNDSDFQPIYRSININTRDINTPVNSYMDRSGGDANRQSQPQRDFRSLDTLMAAPEVRQVASRFKLTDALIARSLRELQHHWKSRGAPDTPRKAVQRAAAWLTEGEKTGKHATWRREAPLEMAGIGPQ